MKKAANVLLIIAVVCGFLIPLVFIVISILGFLVGDPSNTQQIIDAINNGTLKTEIPGTVEEQAKMIQLVARIAAIVMLVLCLPSIASSILALAARKHRSIALDVLLIVFSVISGNEIGAVAGGFAIAVHHRNEDIA